MHLLDKQSFTLHFLLVREAHPKVNIILCPFAWGIWLVYGTQCKIHFLNVSCLFSRLQICVLLEMYCDMFLLSFASLFFISSFLYSGMVLITVLLCVAGLCGSTKRPLTRSHWLIHSTKVEAFIMSLLCISDLHPFTSHSSSYSYSTTKADFSLLSLFLLSLFSLTTPSTHINLTFTAPVSPVYSEHVLQS